jgi:hypothetical protein
MPAPLRLRCLILSSIAASCAAYPSYAQDTSDGWHVSVTPYLWLTGVEGELTAPFPLPGREVTADFGDLMDHLDGAFLGKGEVRYDRFGVLGDILYLKVSGGNTRNPENLPTIGTKLKLSTTAATLAAYYRVADSDPWKVDLLAGLRYNEIETTLDATLGGPGVGRSVSKDWTDPIVGVRAIVRTGERGSLTGYADYGGFGVNNSTVWQVFATYNYQWTENVAVSAGYRHYAIDLDKRGFQYDLNLSGPLVGISYEF